ncbi:type VI secretion system Vgr family protein [Roseomonas sp. USHLN139]|uniref:type VI secretion system Vgr family protein n=1 Tax=Roseomonas sp. USHLN139 TaxID=3081298 RepID=UPI003B012DCC
MSAGFVQADRLLQMTTPLGPDVLVLRALEVTEAIGQLFTIEAEAMSERDDIRAEELIGRGITCTVQAPGREPRHFHGLVQGFSRAGDYGRGTSLYRITAVPRLWQLSRTADCRIFQNQSAQRIVQTLLEEGHVSPVRFGNLPSAPRNYCVQWNETDLDFVQRLLDEVGAGYFFRHEMGEHTLHVTGANADFPAIPCPPVTNRPGAENGGPDSVWGWTAAVEQRPGKSEAVDFDQLRPGALLKAQASTVMSTSAAEAEMYSWPGNQTARPDADPARLQMERDEAAAERVRAEGGEPAIFAGGRLQVAPALGAAPVPWLVTSVVHRARDDSHIAGGSSSHYGNSLVLIPAERTWRGAAAHPRPTMPGLQSAIVTGPQGGEIHCDEHGRVKVHFHWDRAGPRSDGSSCWVRVAQPWGGAWGGTWFLPRVGDEVLVGFMDGDPDKPVVIGSLYNDVARHPHALPGNMTQSWITSRSSKGGGPENANILRMEDKMGAEELYLQAEKDMNVLVRDNRDTTLQRGNETLTVQKGDIAVTAEQGKIAIEAMQSITLTVGGSKITIDPTGITLEATLITARAGGTARIEAPLIQEEASGSMILKGGIVHIN